MIDTRIPLLEPPPHTLNLLHIQHLGLHPINPRHLGHLVDGPPQQSQAQGLHNQVLDLVRLDLGLLANRPERHRAVVRGPAEHGFRQRG